MSQLSTIFGESRSCLVYNTIERVLTDNLQVPRPTWRKTTTHATTFRYLPISREHPAACSVCRLQLSTICWPPSDCQATIIVKLSDHWMSKVMPSSAAAAYLQSEASLRLRSDRQRSLNTIYLGCWPVSDQIVKISPSSMSQSSGNVHPILC